MVSGNNVTETNCLFLQNYDLRNKLVKVNPTNEDEYTSKNDSAVKNTFEYNFHAMSNQKDAEEKMLTHVGMAKEMVLLRKTAYPMICPYSRQKWSFVFTDMKDRKKGCDKENFCFIRENKVINRPGVAGAVL